MNENNSKNLDLAHQLLESEKLADSKAIYLKILKSDPDNFNAMHYLGIIESKSGNKENAVKLISRAIELKNDWPEAYYNLGNVFFDLGRFQDALNNYHKALLIKQNYPEVLYNMGLAFYQLGNTLFDQGRLEETEYCYNKVAELRPEWEEIFYNLGLVQQTLGKLREAEISYKKALQLYPGFAEALYNLGLVLKLQQKLDEAENCFREVIVLEPALIEANNEIAQVLLEKGNVDNAIVYLNHTLSLYPDWPEAIYSLGNAMVLKSNLTEGINCFRKAISLKPDYFYAYNNLFMALQYSSELTGEQWKKEVSSYSQECDRLPRVTNHKNEKNPNKKLRIGYVSPDFRLHSCSWFIEPLFSGHNRDLFEIICFSEVGKPDFVTKKLIDYAQSWYNTVGMSDEQMVEIIWKEKIDILVDLAGHTANNRLTVFARKPAPVQVSWLGFPATTGIKAIDYYISDPWLTAVDTTEYFCEQLLRLNGPAHCYNPPEHSPEINELPFVKNNFITFGSFNNYAKISDITIKLWSDVLKAVPDSKLLLKGYKKVDDAELWQRIKNTFNSFGIEIERINFLTMEPDINMHLKQYNQVDIALDTFPYNGATTTMEALWMGVPVISLSGDRPASRYGLSFLSGAGLGELVAKTAEHFVEIAVLMANNSNELINLRQTLRKGVLASRVCDRKSFVTEMENSFRQIWKTWCNQ